MARYIQTVLATPKPGTEEDYNRWHRDEHVHDVLDVPGFVSARRFRLAQPGNDGKPVTWQFFTIYEVETDDPAAMVAEMGRRYGTEQMPKSPLSDPSKTVTLLWEPVSEHKAGDRK